LLWQVIAAGKAGITTPTAEEQAFTQARVSAVVLQALVVHLGNAAIAKVAAEATTDPSKTVIKGTVPTVALAAAAVASPSAEILRGLLAELEPEVCPPMYSSCSRRNFPCRVLPTV
jgi:hypothetical protein